MRFARLRLTPATPIAEFRDLAPVPPGMGENGRSKTSLLEVLSGALRPDAGTVRRTGTPAVVDQKIPLPSEGTVGDLLGPELTAELTEALVATVAAVVRTTHDRHLLRGRKGWSRLTL